MHPIIALWCHPRSMSTAVERVMRERGDIQCFHEPFMYDYYVHRRVRTMPHFNAQADHPVSYTEVRRMLLESAATQGVFFKDMSYYVVPQILEDEELQQRLTHCFLIREPRAAILSYYRLDPQVTSEEIGLQAQLQQVEALLRRGIQPLILQSEHIRMAPELSFGRLCHFADIPERPQALQWQQQPAQDWQQVEGWHGAAIASRSINPLSETERQQQHRKTAIDFDTACQSAPQLQQFYDQHLPCFLELKKMSQTMQAMQADNSPNTKQDKQRDEP